MDIVDKFKYAIVGILAIIAIGFSSYKIDIVHSSHLQANKKSKIITMATVRYKNALKDYQARMEHCEKLQKSNKLTEKNKLLLNSLPITKKQLDKVIYILSTKAMNNCEKDEFGFYLIERGKYTETLKHYNKALDEDFYTNDMLFVIPYNFYDIELDYLNIPLKHRVKIENINQLQHPFFPLDIVNK